VFGGLVRWFVRSVVRVEFEMVEFVVRQYYDLCRFGFGSRDINDAFLGQSSRDS